MDPCARHDLVGMVGGAGHPSDVLPGLETLLERSPGRFHQRVVQLVRQVAHVAKHLRPVPRQRGGIGDGGESDRQIVTHAGKIA